MFVVRAHKLRRFGVRGNATGRPQPLPRPPRQILLWDRDNVILCVYGMCHGESYPVSATTISLPATEEGPRTKVVRKDKAQLEGIDTPVRLRVNWECERLDDVFLYAAYVGDSQD